MVKIKRFIRINEKISAPQVRLIGPKGEQLGIVSLEKAKEIANQYDLDLVEVAPTADPPVCRIIDFSKFKYDQEKKERLAKKHQHKVHIKEIHLQPNIDEHDYQIKLKQIIGFLNKKDKIKINLFFRGRQLEHIDLGKKLIERIILDTQEFAQVEKEPTLEGKVMSMIIVPK
ncbi:MAG: translation initiation factor IF-3 [Candidatus Omnitrophica bacterium]|nr:translation initiation factor IF-3 [Candidatus Omnitrophota bacterium]MCM8800097.1 translation initiation factor IF-3 [Candidatus Omnitrophota bacterium]